MIESPLSIPLFCSDFSSYDFFELIVKYFMETMDLMLSFINEIMSFERMSFHFKEWDP